MEPDEARAKAADARRLAYEAGTATMRAKWLKVAAAWEELSTRPAAAGRAADPPAADARKA